MSLLSIPQAQQFSILAEKADKAAKVIWERYKKEKRKNPFFGTKPTDYEFLEEFDRQRQEILPPESTLVLPPSTQNNTMVSRSRYTRKRRPMFGRKRSFKRRRYGRRTTRRYGRKRMYRKRRATRRIQSGYALDKFGIFTRGIDVQTGVFTGTSRSVTIAKTPNALGQSDIIARALLFNGNRTLGEYYGLDLGFYADATPATNDQTQYLVKGMKFVCEFRHPTWLPDFKVTYGYCQLSGVPSTLNAGQEIIDSFAGTRAERFIPQRLQVNQKSKKILTYKTYRWRNKGKQLMENADSNTDFETASQAVHTASCKMFWPNGKVIYQLRLANGEVGYYENNDFSKESYIVPFFTVQTSNNLGAMNIITPNLLMYFDQAYFTWSRQNTVTTNATALTTQNFLSYFPAP